MIVLFGKTRSGKDSSMRYLVEKLGYEFIVSYTDRPIRDTEENGREHIFVTPEEMDKLYESDDMVLKTHIVDPILSLKDRNYRGYRYCTRKADLKDNSVAILDLNGIIELKKNNVECISIFITSPYDVRKERAVSTNVDLEVFEKRCRDEYSQFTEGVRDYADFVVDNNSTLEELYHRLDTIIKLIRE